MFLRHSEFQIKGKFDGTGLIKENGINYSIYELAGIWNSKEMYSFVESMGYDNPGRKPFIDTAQLLRKNHEKLFRYKIKPRKF